MIIFLMDENVEEKNTRFGNEYHSISGEYLKHIRQNFISETCLRRQS